MSVHCCSMWWLFTLFLCLVCFFTYLHFTASKGWCLFWSCSYWIECSIYYEKIIQILLVIGVGQWWGPHKFLEKELRRLSLWISWTYARRIYWFLIIDIHVFVFTPRYGDIFKFWNDIIFIHFGQLMMEFWLAFAYF